MSLKSLHDRVLECKPEDAMHPDDCPLCLIETATEITTNGGIPVSEKTYTSQEVEALVAAAVAKSTEDLSQELSELKVTKESADTEGKIAAAKADADAQVTEIQKRLDEAVIEAQQVKQERDEIVAYFTEVEAAEAMKAEIESRQEERALRVAAIVTFPEEYVTERAEKWAALSDEDFDATLADYKALAEKIGQKPESQGIPHVAAMHATRETNGSGNGKVGSAVREVLALRQLGVDPRDIR